MIKRTPVVRTLILLIAMGVASAQLAVDTVAGGKIRSGVPARDVTLSYISGMAWDTSGNLAFCDSAGNLIRRVRPDGTIETVVGNGTAGFSGDGGPALNAALSSPGNPRYDGDGKLYFADAYNYRIRRVDARGVITTVAGDGVTWRTGMDREGPALARSLGTIIDLAVDVHGNVYFTDGTDAVLRVTPDGRMEVFASLASPGLLALDGAGNLYVGEGGASTWAIRRIAPDGSITPFAGYGQPPGRAVNDDGLPAVDTYLYRISGMGTDAAGNVYLAQPQIPVPRGAGTRIRRIDTNGILTTMAGASSIINADRLAADARGNVAFSESSYTGYGFGGILREVTAQGTLQALAGDTPKAAPDGMAVRDAWFVNPVGIAFNRAGELYIVEQDACLIRKIGADGLLATAAGTGKCGTSEPQQPNTTQDLAHPASIAIDSQNRIYVVDPWGNLYVITPDGRATASPLRPGVGPGNKVAIDSKDRLYVLGMFSLVRFTADGKQQTIVSPPTQAGVPPQGFGPTSLGAIGVDPSGNVYFTGEYLGPTGQAIFRVNDDGTFVQVYGGTPGNPLLFGNSGSLTVDATGAVWLGTTVVNGGGRFSVGRQEPGFSGDGGLAQAARFSAIASARAPNGDLYVVDNSRIRKLTGAAPARAPSIAPGGIVNAASYTGGAVAPGELVSIFGSDFGAGGLQVSAPENNRIPWQLGRVKVLFDGFAGAITAVTPNQINVFVPDWIEPGQTTSVVVQVDAAVSAAVIVPVVKATPGISTADASGAGQGAILNQDGSLNSSANPAAQGSIVSLFGTGAGAMSPQLLWGDLSISTPYSTPVEAVTVSIGGLAAEVLYAGAAPLEPIGVFQVNARIPPTAAAGDAPVSVTIGGVSTARQPTVAVR